jgi:hypothetical protein
MDDLFRFLLLRPASPAASTGVKTLIPSYVGRGVSVSVARTAARAFVDKNAVLRSIDGLTYAAAADAVVGSIGTGAIKAKDLSNLVRKSAGKTAADAAADPKFLADEKRLADSLVAMKLLSDSFGGDAPGLARLAQGYDAIRLAATGLDPVSLRVLSIDTFTGPAPGNDPP